MGKKILTFVLVAHLAFCWAAAAVAKGPEKKGTIRLANGLLLTGEDLREIISSHNRWLRSGGTEGERANLEGAFIGGVELNGVDFRNANMKNVNFELTSLDGARFSLAELSGARFYKSSLFGAKFIRTILSGARLIESNLATASFYRAELVKARVIRCNFNKTNLQKTNFAEAFVKESSFHNAKIWSCAFERAFVYKSKFCWMDCRQANLSDAKFVSNDFLGASINILPGKIPLVGMLATGENLSSITYSLTPHSLIELRTAARNAGLRIKEREITYALMHNQRLRTYNLFWRTFAYLLFELPSGWGLHPDRPLIIMLILIPFFFLPYLLALSARGKNGIWMEWAQDRARKDLGSGKPVRLIFQLTQWRAYAYALYFSILSAFHIGWRDLNVGTWISRMQPNEYTLRATGWARTVSGIQSLISVYLLALAVLTYFGRPFG